MAQDVQTGEIEEGKLPNGEETAQDVHATVSENSTQTTAPQN